MNKEPHTAFTLLHLII